MVLFDNLANLLASASESLFTDYREIKDWKILGEEPGNRVLVGWTVDGTKTETCIGVFQFLDNNLTKVCTLDGSLNVIQASVNDEENLISYVIRDNCDPPVYRHFISAVNGGNPVEGIVRTRQIMTVFLESSKSIRLLVMVHTEAVRLNHVKCNGEEIEITKSETIANSFSWAQWDLSSRCLYFIHFRKSRLQEEDGDGKIELSPTLTTLQFHPDLPHETVLNIPLNLPSLSKNPDAAPSLYEDDCIPLRVHDCSLDLLVITDASGLICICHHYLYQPVKSPAVGKRSPNDDNMTVHFAYSVTLLHHGCVIHCAVPGVPWSLAKTLRPGFTLLGSQYLLIHGPGVLSHLLDIGLVHEPFCHILLLAELEAVPREVKRLVNLHSQYADMEPHTDDSLAPSVMLDLTTLDLIEVEVTKQDLLVAFEKIKTVSNRLAILHYFLVHLVDMSLVEEVLSCLPTEPQSVDFSFLLQEVLVGGAYSVVRRTMHSDAANLLNLLPISCLDPSRKFEIKVDNKTISIAQEILWNTAMMLLSPQQRIVPYRADIWTRLWDTLSRCSETPRFKPSLVAEKLTLSLACYQPEALSRCTTPMSPAPGFVPVCSFIDLSGFGQVSGTRKSSTNHLPFVENDSCTASQQEHVISANLRELNLYLMKNCNREAPMHVHAVTTRYVTAQLDISKQLCHLLCVIAGIGELTGPEKGFPLIRRLDSYRGHTLLTLLLRYHHASQTLAYPQPLGFSSFFSYLGFTILPFNMFQQFLQSNVFQLKVDVMKEIMADLEDTPENIQVKLKLLLEMPRSRAKRLLNSWSHPVSLMIRAREHSLNVLSGVQGARPKSQYARRSIHASRGLAAFPTVERVSPLDTFLDLLTAKASLTELDFNLLIEATVLSTEEFL